MADWVPAHRELVTALGLLSVAMFAAGVGLLPVLLAHLPADLLVRAAPPPQRRSHPVVWMAWRILKNLLGAAVVLLGLALLVLPGQGILTIVMGLGLLDLPGRHRIILAVLRRPRILRAVNAIRARAGEPPLRTDA